MTIRWSTLVTDADGVISYERVNHFIVALLALIGGLMVIGGALMEIMTKVNIPTGQMMLMSGVLVAPITVKGAAEMVGNKLQAKLVADATANATAAATTAAANAMAAAEVPPGGPVG